MARDIHGDVSDLENCVGSVPTNLAPENALYSQHEFARAEWFCQVIIRPELKSEDAIDFLSFGRQQQDGNPFCRGISLKNLAYLQPCETRHHHIKDDESRMFHARLAQGAGAIGGLRNLKSRRPQIARN